MASRFEKDSPNNFRKEIIAFFRCCGVEEILIDQIMVENDHLLNNYLVATPELIARKLYQAKTGELL